MLWNARTRTSPTRSRWESYIESLDKIQTYKLIPNSFKDLLDQLGDGGRSIHDLDKQRRRLEVSPKKKLFSTTLLYSLPQVEKEELQGALEEAEGALEQEENKVGVMARFYAI